MSLLKFLIIQDKFEHISLMLPPAINSPLGVGVIKAQGRWRGSDNLSTLAMGVPIFF